MNTTAKKNPLMLKVGETINHFLVKRIVSLEAIASTFYALEHDRTAAQYIHIHNQDSENTFGVAFKTVPTDSTGVAHILEHTALCGSDKFPVRDPFFSMLKRSLSTFMNAFTASDWTMYPFSTQNKKDFYNLMDVYLNAAFFPKLEKLSFMQEGHRLEFESMEETSDTPLVYKGVVYNEMKGAMSSPNQVMARSLQNALYPSTTYRFNSGGEPTEIPTLTHEQLKSFHQRHYHPSNAFFYTYGDLDLREHLDFINNNVISAFNRIDPGTEVMPQPRWTAPKEAIYTYPLDKNEDPTKKYQFCIAWLTSDITDSYGVLILTLLEQILIGNAASHLRKALIDSELGSALSDGTGFDPDNRDTLFACGLKDVTLEAAPKITSIIFDTLNDLVQKGIDKDLIEAAIHQVEFHRKEITNTPYPFGLKLLLTFAGSWFHGGLPEKALKFEEDLKKLRSDLAREPLFENCIKSMLLDNPHRVNFLLKPDHTKTEQEAQKIKTQLQKIKDHLSNEQIAEIKNNAIQLNAIQEAEEDLSCLPTLEIEDIPPTIQSVKASAQKEGVAISAYNQSTSGIFYYSSISGIRSIPLELRPMVPLFCMVFNRIGTHNLDYTKLARFIDRYTGGVNISAHARTSFKHPQLCLPYIILSGKSLVRNQSKLFEILEDLIFNVQFTDLTRLKSLLMEYRAGLESTIVANGHRYAISLASRNFSQTAALSEDWSGVHHFQRIKTLTADLSEAGLSELADNLKKLGQHLFKQKNLKMALIGEETALSEGLPEAGRIYQRMPEADPTGNDFYLEETPVSPTVIREGWSTAATVAFVAETFHTVPYNHPDSPALSVISKILRSAYLHREIREKGGAYGGFAIYNAEDGLFSLCSYRDPHIYQTLNVYQKAAQFIRSGAFTPQDVKEAILQTCSDIDKPDTPAAAARKAFIRTITGLTDESRAAYKQTLLGLTRQSVLNVAEKYFAEKDRQCAVTVISSEQKLKDANAQLKQHELMLNTI